MLFELAMLINQHFCVFTVSIETETLYSHVVTVMSVKSIMLVRHSKHKTGSAQHCKHVLFLGSYFLNYTHLLIFSKDVFNASVWISCPKLARKGKKQKRFGENEFLYDHPTFFSPILKLFCSFTAIENGKTPAGFLNTFTS